MKERLVRSAIVLVLLLGLDLVPTGVHPAGAVDPPKYGGPTRPTTGSFTGGITASAVTNLQTIITDPANDRIVSADPVVEILKVEGGSNATDVTVRMTFSADTAISSAAGYVMFDTDQNAVTGQPPSSLFGKTTQNIGFDYVAVFNNGLGLVDVWGVDLSGNLNFVVELPDVIAGQTVEFTIPLSYLGYDDGRMDVVMNAGVNSAADWAPDTGHGTIGPTASGGSSATISYSILFSTVCVSVSPATITYGPVTLSDTKVSAQTTATNCGTGAANFQVQGANATAAVSGESNWTLGAAPGANAYVHSFGDTAGGAFTAMTTAATSLAASVAAGGSKNFYTQVKTPTTTTGAGARNTTVTVIATVP